MRGTSHGALIRRRADLRAEWNLGTAIGCARPPGGFDAEAAKARADGEMRLPKRLTQGGRRLMAAADARGLVEGGLCQAADGGG